MRQQYLRLDLQVKVDLCGVESHTHSAQDDVKCSLVHKKGRIIWSSSSEVAGRIYETYDKSVPSSRS